MDEVVSPVLHNKLVPVADNTELPQLLTTVTTGGRGIAFGAAVPLPAGLVQPLAELVWVTVYVPPVITVMEAVVCPLLHSKLPADPDAVRIDWLQSLATVTTGAKGIALGAATALPAGLVHPFTVCVTV